MNHIVTTSAEVRSSPCTGSALHRRSSSHHRSTFHFPCVLSCFSSHLVSIPSITCCVFNPLFPPCLCVGLFIVSACARVYWWATGFCTQYVVIFMALVLLLNCSGYYYQVLLSCVWLPCHRLRTPYSGKATFFHEYRSVMFGANPKEHITEYHSPYFQR